MKKANDWVGIKEACDLWQRDIRTLKKWVASGELRAQCIKVDKKDRPQWYFETPAARYERLHITNNKNQ